MVGLHLKLLYYINALHTVLEYPSMYLWFWVNLWVHLRAEEGKETHFVPSSDVVLLSVGHTQSLILHRFSIDHHGGGEPQGLVQNALCKMETTASG